MARHCEDCIHNEVCEALEQMNGIPRIFARQCGYFRDKSRYIELPCKVGDLVHFKGLDIPWKVSSIHFYAEGRPQISITSGSGKITTTMTFPEFEEIACVITEKGGGE